MYPQCNLNALRVNCTFVLVKQKKRVTVAGMEGWSLLDTAQHHNLPINGVKAENAWEYLRVT